MVFVFGGLAAMLLFVAYRTKDKVGRLIFLGFALLNLVALVMALAERHPYRFKLMPDDGQYERDYRR